MDKIDQTRNQLPECDMKILAFVNARGEADLDTITKAFPRIAAVPLRVKRLAAQRYYSPDGSAAKRRPVPDTSYLVCVTGEPEVYRITDLGKITVQDDKFRRRRERRLMWLKNAWIPVLVSLLTGIIVNGPRPLWPLIAEWAANILP